MKYLKTLELLAQRLREEQRLRKLLKKHAWIVSRGIGVDRLRTLWLERVKEVQSENPDLALVLPDYALTASFEVGEEFLAAVDPVLKDWNVRLGDLLRSQKNRKILRAQNLKETEWIHGTYLLRGEPISYKELKRYIRAPR